MFEEGFQTTHTATRFPAGRNGIISYNGHEILSIIYFLFIYLFFSFPSFFFSPFCGASATRLKTFLAKTSNLGTLE